MALIAEAAFKTQAAAIATAVTAAWKDSVDTAVALDISNAKHPLRQIEKLLLFNTDTGVVTSDDVYITAVYAGRAPSKSNPLDFTTGFPVVLVTATVEDAAPTLIVMTYNQNLIPNNLPAVGAYVVGGTQSYAITNVAVSGKVLTLTSASAFIVTDTVEISYTAGGSPLLAVKDRRQVSNLVDQAVTNNVT